MTCYDELTLSIHVDGELPPVEADELRSHLARCAACRTKLTALRTEAESLGLTLREVPQLLPGPTPPSTFWIWIGALAAALVGAAASLHALRHLASLPEWLGLDPLDPVFTLAFLMLETGLERLQEGVPVMPSMLPLLVMVFLAFAALRHRRARTAVLVLTLISLAAAVEATQTRFPPKGSNTVVIGPQETIGDTLFAAGDTVVVQGTVDGDLIAMGREARVEGAVKGSVLCLAKRLEITGTVQGDIYTLNETLAMRGRIGRSVHAMTQNTDLDASATVERDLFTLAKEVRVAGNLGRRLSAGVQMAELSGSIGGKADVSTQRLQVSDSARIAGDLVVNLSSKELAAIGSGARIEGQTHVVANDVRGPRSELSRFLEPSFYLWQALWVAAALLCGALLRWLAPVVFEPRPVTGPQALGTAGMGLVALIVTPVAVLLAGVTVVGLPAAIIALGGWMTALYVAGILASAWLGQLVLRREAGDMRTFLLALLVGQLVLRVAKPLPWIGGLTGFVVLLLGLGLVVAASRAVHAQLRARS